MEKNMGNKNIEYRLIHENMNLLIKSRRKDYLRQGVLAAGMLSMGLGAYLIGVSPTPKQASQYSEEKKDDSGSNSKLAGLSLILMGILMPNMLSFYRNNIRK